MPWPLVRHPHALTDHQPDARPVLDGRPIPSRLGTSTLTISTALVVIGRADTCAPRDATRSAGPSPAATGRMISAHRPEAPPDGYASRRTGRGKRLVSASVSRHNSYMLEKPTADDLEKAHLILSEFGLLVGPAGAMSDVIARAVAAGIAVGRKEALAKTRRSKSSESSAS